MLRQGTYYDSYKPGHPAKAVEVTVAIMEEFCNEARQRGQQPLVLIIPTHIDLANYRRVGKWVYKPLTDILVQRKLEFIDLGPSFLQYLGDRNLETLYNPKTQYHLNEKGNWLLAKIVYNYLIQNNFSLRANLEN